MNPTHSTSLWVRLAYGFGSTAYGIKNNGFSYFLLFYYDQVLGLSAGLAGAAILIALLFDAFSDPIVGYVSDNWHSRWGRRHPFMYASAIPVAASYLFLWNPPDGLSETGLFAWLLVVAVLVRTLITLYEIPSTSLVAEFTDSYDERTSLLSYRYLFAWWGGLTMAVLAYWVFFATDATGGQGQLEAAGYRTYGQVASVLMAIGIVVSAAGTHHRIPSLKTPPERDRPDFRQALRELRETLSNHSIRVLFSGAIVYAWAAGLDAALNIYLNTYFWGMSSAQLGWFNVAYFGGALIPLSLAPLLARRIGKKRAAIGMSIAAMIPYPTLIVLRVGGYLPPLGSDPLFAMLLVINTLNVAMLVTSNVLVAAMVADVVEESELETGRRSEGVFFAARSFAEKSISGFGIVGATMLLALVDFPSDVSAAASVSDEVLTKFGLAYVAATLTFYAITVGIYSRYRISRANHEENLRQLAEREGPA
jgi:Na+/melibiose symporter-like transporter